MKLHHIGFWSRDIEALAEFYVKHWNGRVLFRHTSGDFRCLFMQVFENVKLELMTRSALPSKDVVERVGYSHFSVEVASKAEVDRITEYCLAQAMPMTKVRVQYEDGFYESAFVDPDGNMIEIAYVDRNVNGAV